MSDKSLKTAHGFRPMESTPLHPSTGKLRTSTTSSVWRPLRGQTFRDLLIADIFSDVGTFMQSVGAAWLMLSINAGPLFVALTQTASALPFFLFALPASSLDAAPQTSKH
jgi:hypothetical protein